MGVFSMPDFSDHEQVVFCSDAASGLRAIVAIHDTTLGPALGGCRMWPYASEQDALRDVLRLSRGMTYKAALAGLALGGGKSVVIGDPRHDKRPALLDALARAIDRLGGRYIAAEDSGTGVADMARMRTLTPHVVGVAAKLRADGSASGDPSPATASGVLVGIRTAVRERLGRADLAGLRVAVQGLGNVGRHLARQLHEAGARLWVADVDRQALLAATRSFPAKVVPPESICALDVDVFAPCALGAVIDDQSLPMLRAAVVAGSANNQLAAPRHGAELARRGILYAPDYVINAGGLIDVHCELTGYDPERVRRGIERIGDTLQQIFAQARESGDPTSEIADRLAEERLRQGRAEPA